jgi:hypothetical protein
MNKSITLKDIDKIQKKLVRNTFKISKAIDISEFNSYFRMANISAIIS